MNDASRTEHKILLYVDILSSLISDKDWELFCREGYEITNSPIWKEFEWKVKMRFFSTPLVVWKFNGSSDKCWRGCGLVGDQTHIFWDFQRLLGYWQNILHTQLCMEVCVCVELKRRFFLLHLFQQQFSGAPHFWSALVALQNCLFSSCLGWKEKISSKAYCHSRHRHTDTTCCGHHNRVL